MGTRSRLERNTLWPNFVRVKVKWAFVFLKQVHLHPTPMCSFPGILDVSEIHLQGRMLLSPTWPCLPLSTQWGTMPWKTTLTSKELPQSRTNPAHSQ